MKTHVFETELWLPQPPGEVFGFFGDAGNLETLTPRSLRFEILTPRPIEMRAGALIDYRLRVHGVPIRWRTEITAWDPPHRFVDTQLRGPYRLWVHEHTFTPQRGGSLIKDRVRYAAVGGTLIHRWLIRPDLERIFAYRGEVLRKIFVAQKPPDGEIL
ncbi:MAG TPA: SRPBCC family protein [Tepidisphaeraceae bacterium]|nr:SRPBCC family protein [Tepidisphaeraceae bacterium]